jgi:hypothetical protein
VEAQKTLPFQNDIQKTSVAYLELQTESNRYKTSESFVSNDPRGSCCCAPPLGVTIFQNGYPAKEELACYAVSEERISDSCTVCISHTASHGTTQSTENVCEVHVAQLLQTLFSINA